MKHPTLRFLLLAILLAVVAAWTKEDHEIFRLRDEMANTEGLNVTFYDFLGIKPNANQDQVNKAYRKKSKLLHPDKVKRAFIANSAKDPKSTKKSKTPGVHVSTGPSERQVKAIVKEAHERAARLNLVANILRGPSRERYDHFLKHGFPKWKGTGYYYSRFRPGLGSVLGGLFLVFGGAGHYLALVLSWKRQREFVDRYIRHARKAAWGDESGVPGLDVASPPAPAPFPAPDTEEEGAPVAMNRRQKRMMEKENRKEGKKSGKGNKKSGSGTATPVSEVTTSTGSRKRVVAENGKVLIVDSVGNVFLEEETEDGEQQEFLLDVEEIPRPTFRDTVVFRLPAWCYLRTVGRLLGSSQEEEVIDEAHDDADTIEETTATGAATAAPAGPARMRVKRAHRS